MSISCEKSGQGSAPIAGFTISPDSGDIETIYTFNASACSDIKDNVSDLSVRWDWESDSVWDTQFSTTKIIQKRFNYPGTYSITLEVKNSYGLSSTITKQLVVSQTTTGTLNDTRDGTVYKTVKIGNQWWMAENLNYKKLVDSWCYEDNSANCEIYGRLYEFSTAYYACPDGWHLPSDKEWKELELFLGMSQSDTDSEGSRRNSGDVGIKLRSVNGWGGDNNGSNESGFNALPGGYWMNVEAYNYQNLGGLAYFWTKSAVSNYVWVRGLSMNEIVERTRMPKTWRLSVRCLKD